MRRTWIALWLPEQSAPLEAGSRAGGSGSSTETAQSMTSALQRARACVPLCSYRTRAWFRCAAPRIPIGVRCLRAYAGLHACRQQESSMYAASLGNQDGALRRWRSEAHALDTPRPLSAWRCFHCQQTFLHGLTSLLKPTSRQAPSAAESRRGRRWPNTTSWRPGSQNVRRPTTHAAACTAFQTAQSRCVRQRVYHRDAAALLADAQPGSAHSWRTRHPQRPAMCSANRYQVDACRHSTCSEHERRTQRRPAASPCCHVCPVCTQ